MQEFKIIINLVLTVVITLLYAFKTKHLMDIGYFAGTDGHAHLGKHILILIGLMAIANIVMVIFGTIIYTIIQKKCDNVDKVDERDKMIELKSMQISYAIFGGGFVLGLCSLAFGWSVINFILIMVLSIIIAEIIGNLNKLILYRRGF